MKISTPTKPPLKNENSNILTLNDKKLQKLQQWLLMSRFQYYVYLSFK